MMRGALFLLVTLLGACSEGTTLPPTASSAGSAPTTGGGAGNGSVATTSGAGGAPTIPSPTPPGGAAGSEPGPSGAAGLAQAGQSPGGQSGQSGASNTNCPADVTAVNRAVVAAALDALFVAKQLSAIDQYWAEPYLQHNPIAESGVAAFESIMSSVVSSPSFSYERLRTFAECDLVVVHGRYSGTGVIFDMFRVKDGKLVEHWDSDAGQASDAGGTTDNPPGPDTDANRALVLAMNEHTKVHHVIADGSFVFTLSEGEEGGVAYGYYDLFRLQEGQIVERWSSRRRVPGSTASGLGIF